MTRYSPYEKKIWQKGFFCGLSTAKQKYQSSMDKTKFSEIKDILTLFIDDVYSQFSHKLDKLYRRKIHLKCRSGSLYNNDMMLCRTIIEFCSFCRTVGIDAFLEFLLSSTFFEQILFCKNEDKPDEI